MSSKEIGIEEARKSLGDLADAAHHHGEITTLTKYGRPHAQIAPVSQEPAMASLTTSEREDIESAKAAIRAVGPGLERDRATARQLADLFRENLPGVDEVTIGRVLLMAAAAIPQLTRTGHDPRGTGNVFTLAAIDLTAHDQV